MPLVNLRSLACYVDQNQSFKMSVHHEDLDVDFVLQHFNLRYIDEGNEETESYRRRGFLSVLENFNHSTQLRRRKSTDRDSRQEKTSGSFDKYKQTYLHLIILTNSLAICSVFFEDQQKKDGGDFKPDTMSSF